MVTLLLVRHAEAVGNKEHRFIGQTDVALTELGRTQVAHLTQRIVRRPITRVISSDLQRCVQTVTPAADHLGIDVELEPRLREIANGDWNGLLPEEIETRWPEMFGSYRNGVDVPRPGGERWADVSDRVCQTLVELAHTANDDDTILIGTHAGPTLAAVRWAASIPVNGNVFRGPFTGVENTSISTIFLPGPRLAGFNDSAHLEG